MSTGTIEWIAGSNGMNISNKSYQTIKTDTSGNVYTVHSINDNYSTNTLRILNPGGAVATTISISSVFGNIIIKRNSTGTYLGHYTIFGSQLLIPNAIDIDSSGSLYLIGFRYNSFTATIGSSFTVTTMTLTKTTDDWQGYFVKWNSSGVPEFAFNPTDQRSSAAWGIKIVGSEIFVSCNGTWRGSSNVMNSNNTIFRTIPNTSGVEYSLIIKYNLSGMVLSAFMPFSTGQNTRPFAIDVDASGNIYLGGRLGTNTTYTIYNLSGTNSETSSGSTMSSGAPVSAFILKYNSSGVYQWNLLVDGAATAQGNWDSEQVFYMQLRNNFIYCPFISQSTTITVARNGTQISSTGSQFDSSLVYKFDLNGNLAWLVKATASVNTRYALFDSVAVDELDRVYIGGSFDASSYTFTSSNNTTTSFNRLTTGPTGFIAWLDSSGIYQRGNQFTNANNGDGVNTWTKAGQPEIAYYNGKVYVNAQLTPSTTIYDTSGNVAGTFSANGSETTTNATFSIRANTLYNTWISRESSRNWYGIASSANGMNLAAIVYGGFIYTSVNGGISWTQRESSRNWNGIASSSTGGILYACEYNGNIYKSTNFGASWSPVATSVGNKQWSSIACSTDGTIVAACTVNDFIYVSLNSGSTWTSTASSADWRAIAMSANGTQIVAAGLSNFIWTGVYATGSWTWTSRDSSRAWISVASSADGTKLVAGTNLGQVYTSTNSGASWTARNSSRYWRSLASSDDGSKLFAAIQNDGIYYSSDSGVNWTRMTTSPLNEAYVGVACSYDGIEAAVATYGGPLYTYDNTALTPGPPVSLTATPSGNGQVTLVWSAPYNSGTSPITSYRVERSTDNVNWLNGTSGTTIYNSTGLTNGTTYYYRVFAVNANGIGSASNTVTVVPGSNPVTGLTATPTGASNTALVSWNAAATKVGFDASNYTVSWTTTNAANYISPYEFNLDSSQGYYYTNFVDPSSWNDRPLMSSPLYNTKFSATSSTYLGSPLTGGYLWQGYDTHFTYNADNFVTTFEISYFIDYNTGFWITVNPGDSRYRIRGEGPQNGGQFIIYGPDSSGNGNSTPLLTSTLPTLGGTLGITRRMNGFTVYRFNGNVYNQIFDISGITWTNTSSKTFGFGQTYRQPFIYIYWVREYPLPVWPGYGVDLSGTTTTSSLSQTLNTIGNNMTYTMSVVTNSALGPSAATTTTVKPRKFAKPIVLRSRVESQLINVRWVRPFQTTDLSNYTVSWTNGTISGSAFVGSSTPQDLSYNITGLPNDGTNYTVTVSTNYTGGSASSQVIQRTISAVPITNLQATPFNNELRLSWTRPTDISGYPTTSYTVSWSDGSASVVDTSYNIIGLTNGTNYTISVVAVSAFGNAPAVTVTAKPYTVPSQVNPVSLSTGNLFIDLSWNAPNNGGIDISSYRVERSTDTSSWIVDVSSNATTSYRSTGLTNGTTYYYRVYARNIAGFSTASTIVSGAPSNAPSAPSGITATAGISQVTLSWTAPYNGGSAITGYRIEKSLDSSAWTVDISNHTDISYTIVGLTNAVPYYFRIYARNINGISPASSVVSATPRDIPDRITSVTLTPGATSVDISWNAPNNNGGTITGYLVERSLNNTVWIVDVSSNPTTSYTSSGLNRGTLYYFRISARNAAGTGFASSSLSTITVSVPHAPVITSIAAGNTSLTVFYDQSSNILPRITKYRYTTNGGISSVERLVNETTSPWFIPNLTNGISYNVQIASYNVNGWSTWSNQMTATPVDNRSPTFINTLATLNKNNITTVANTILSDLSSQTLTQTRQLLFNMAKDISGQPDEVKKGTILTAAMKLTSDKNEIKSDINQQLVDLGVVRNVPFDISDQTIVSQIIDVSAFKVPSWTPTRISIIIPDTDNTLIAKLDVSNILLNVVPNVEYMFSATYNNVSSSNAYVIKYIRTDISRYMLVDSQPKVLGETLIFNFLGATPRTFTFNIFGTPGGESGTGQSGGYGDPKITTVNKDFYYLPYDENCYLLFDNQSSTERVVVTAKCWFLSDEVKQKSSFKTSFLDDKTFFRYINIHYKGENLTIDMETLNPVKYTNMDDVNKFNLKPTKDIPSGINMSSFIKDTDIFRSNYRNIKIKMFNIQFDGKSRIIKLGDDYEFKLSFDLNCADHRNGIFVDKANYTNAIGALVNEKTAFCIDDLVPKN